MTNLIQNLQSYSNMKKAIFYISAIIIGFSSCTKDEAPDVPQTLGVRQVSDNLVGAYHEASKLVQILEAVDQWNRAETSAEKQSIVNRYFGETTALKNYGDSIVIVDFGTVITNGVAFNEPDAQWSYKESFSLWGYGETNAPSIVHTNLYHVQRKGADLFHITGTNLYSRYIKNSYTYALDVEQQNERLNKVTGECDMEIPNYWNRAVSTTVQPLSFIRILDRLIPLYYRGGYNIFSDIRNGELNIDLYRQGVATPAPAQVEFNKDVITIRYAGIVETYNKFFSPF